MASTMHTFFIGAGTTFAILTAGFSGGLMFAKNVREATPPAKIRPAADSLPSVRVILPSSAEAARPPETSEVSAVTAVSSQAAPTPEPVAELHSPIVPDKEVERTPENDKKAERAERRKAEAEDRERRRRVAERRARRDAARIARRMEQQEQQPQARGPGIMAFDDAQPAGLGRSFFGN
jgi:type IV secretory pathway VirB10-like protein